MPLTQVVKEITPKAQDDAICFKQEIEHQLEKFKGLLQLLETSEWDFRFVGVGKNSEQKEVYHFVVSDIPGHFEFAPESSSITSARTFLWDQGFDRTNEIYSFGILSVVDVFVFSKYFHMPIILIALVKEEL